MKKAVILSLVLCLFLCGCSSYKEIDTRYMVASLGFSFSEHYTVFAETVSIGTDNTTATPRVFCGNGNTLENAFSDLQKSFSKDIMLDHCAAIILDAALSKEHQKEVLDFCVQKKEINLSACTAKSNNIKDLLSSVSETAAVGYDIFAIQKKQKTIVGSELFNYIGGKIKPPYFENRNDAATETKKGDYLD